MSTSTAYVRRFRERKREGKLVLPRIEIDNSIADNLVEAELLEEWSTEDPQAIADAVVKLLRMLPLEMTFPKSSSR
jgi:hypothetical protein